MTTPTKKIIKNKIIDSIYSNSRFILRRTPTTSHNERASNLRRFLTCSNNIAYQLFPTKAKNINPKEIANIAQAMPITITKLPSLPVLWLQILAK
jgi:hypothetical protein